MWRRFGTSLGVVVFGVGVHLCPAREVLSGAVSEWLPTKGLVAGSSFEGAAAPPESQRVPGKIGKGFRRGEGPPFVLAAPAGQTMPAWSETTPLSAGLWVYFGDQADRPQDLVSCMVRAGGEVRGWSLFIRPINGQLGFQLSHKYTSQLLVETHLKQFTRGKWNHVGVTYDGSGKANGVRLYVNGSLSKSKPVRNTLSGPTSVQMATQLGGRHGSGDTWPAPTVRMDGVRVYDRTLDPIEMKRLALLVPGNPVGKGAAVRISHAGKGSIMLHEVRVMLDGHNVATTGQASQSSTKDDAVASRAIDGVSDQPKQAGSFSVTRWEEKPWWRVDFPFDSAISTIVVHARTEQPDHVIRLKDARVEVLDADGKVVWDWKITHPQAITVFPVCMVDLETLRPAGAEGRPVKEIGP